jgi:anti-sigma factor RsiW
VMTCREVLDFVMAYLDGELPLEVRAEFDRHLAACPPCIDYLQSYRRTLELARQSLPSSAEEAVPPIPDDLVRAILQSRKK